MSDKIDKLLELMEQEVKTNYNGFEYGLYLLLKGIHAKYELPEFGDRFHKMFRQTDCTDSFYFDMAVWHALQESKVFWKCFAMVEELQERE